MLSSATSTATGRGSSLPSPRRRPPRRISSSSPSLPRPATRPRTCSCGRRSSAPRGSPSRRSRARPRESSPSSARRGSTRPSRTRASCAPTARSRRSTASSSYRTTACSTSSDISSPVASSSSSSWAGRPWASRSVRTSGSPARRRPSSLRAGARLILNLSASPFHVGKAELREEMLVEPRARQRLLPRTLQPRRRTGRARVRRALGWSSTTPAPSSRALPDSRSTFSSSMSIRHRRPLVREPRSRRSPRSSSRCGSPSRSVSATTSRRTGSPRSSSPSRAASTRP